MEAKDLRSGFKLPRSEPWLPGYCVTLGKLLNHFLPTHPPISHVQNRGDNSAHLNGLV